MTSILKFITEITLSISAFTGTTNIHDMDHVVLAGYGNHEVTICYKKETREIESSQLQSYLAKGATSGKCPKVIEDEENDHNNYDEEGNDKKDDKKREDKTETKVESKKN